MMSFRRNALTFSQELVKFVFEKYSHIVYKSASPTYQLTFKPKTSGSEYGLVEKEGRKLFRPIVGRAVVFLQLQHPDDFDVEKTLCDVMPERFEPLAFLQFCAAATLKMAQGYYSKANFTLPEYTIIAIAKALSSYHDKGSFTEESWASLNSSAKSVVDFARIVDTCQEFVPRHQEVNQYQCVVPQAPYVPDCYGMYYYPGWNYVYDYPTYVNAPVYNSMELDFNQLSRNPYEMNS